MPRTCRRLGPAIVVAVLVITGCKVTDFSLFGLIQTSEGDGSERLLAGSIDDVAASLQLSLAQFGLRAVAMQEGEAIRIKSMTRNGKSFSLILTRQQGPNGESTHIRVEWETGPDEAFLLELLSEAGKAKVK